MVKRVLTKSYSTPEEARKEATDKESMDVVTGQKGGSLINTKEECSIEKSKKNPRWSLPFNQSKHFLRSTITHRYPGTSQYAVL